MDLRIAAIVQHFKGILITRNRQDFSHIPIMLFEDWSV